jgi:hypothetical protein
VRYLIFIVILCAKLNLASASDFYFAYKPAHIPIQEAICELRLKDAESNLSKVAANDKNNVVNDYLRLYLVFYRIMVHQDKSLYPLFTATKNSCIEAVKKLDNSSPYKGYIKGNALLLGALVDGAFEEYLGAVTGFRAAHSEINANEKAFPNFLSNKKELGVLQALIGTIPTQYKWITDAVGLKGSIKDGLKLLGSYLDHSKLEPLLERHQAALFYALIELNFEDKKSAFNFYRSYATNTKENLMQVFVLVYIAEKSGNNEVALQVLKQAPSSDAYEKIPYLNYLMGDILLHKLDYTAAIWFKKYLSASVTKNSAKDAYTRLSWIELLCHNKEKFLVYRGMAQKLQKQSSSEVKLVDQDLSAGIFPDTLLLKARLLFDGGYYDKAKLVLHEVSGKVFPSQFQQTEYFYRLGRISQEENRPSDAISNYKKCLEYGVKVNTYLLPNACLQLGNIYAKLGYKDLATDYYKKVATFSKYDYEDSIKQLAKVGLKKLE